MASSSSSSSSSSASILSAKARPFIPPQPRPSPLLPSSQSQPTLSPDAPPFTRSISTPYVPIPFYPSELLGFEDFDPFTYIDDDNLDNSYDYEGSKGMEVGPWNVPFDGQEVGQLMGSGDGLTPWVVPSLDFKGGEPGAHEENGTFPYDIFAASKCVLLKGTPSKPSIVKSTKESSNTSNSNNSYNHYWEQNFQSSKDPMAYYPPDPTSTRVNAPLVRGTSSVIDVRSKSVFGVQKNPIINRHDIRDGKGFLGKGDISNINKYSGISLSSTSKIEGHTSSLNLTKPIKLSNISEKNADKNDDSLENSSKTVSPVDLDVDSPCWKGTLSHQLSPFKVAEATELHLNETNSADGSDVNLQGCLDNTGNLTFDEVEEVSSVSHVEKAPNTISHSLQQIQDTCKEQRTEMLDDRLRKMGAKDKEVVLFDQEMALTSFNQSITKAGIAAPGLMIDACGSASISSKPLSVGEQTQLINETLQVLREKLLSRVYRDDNALKNLLSEVLQLVNDFPEKSVFRIKQISGFKGQEDSAIQQSNINTTKDRTWKEDGTIVRQGNFNTYVDTELPRMQTVEHHATNKQGIANINLTHDNEKFGPYSSGSAPSDKLVYVPSYLNILNEVTNDFEQILRKTLCKKEDIETSFHKNLWIEAQVALLSLKFQLQLVYTEIERLKHNQSIKGIPPEVTRFSLLGCEASHQSESQWSESQ